MNRSSKSASMERLGCVGRYAQMRLYIVNTVQLADGSLTSL